MQRRYLGSTGIAVSDTALGTMNFGGWGNTDRDEVTAMIHRALDAGIDLIDTADRYGDGESERIVGAAIKGRRDDVVLATKFSLPDVQKENPRFSGGSSGGSDRRRSGDLSIFSHTTTPPLACC